MGIHIPACGSFELDLEGHPVELSKLDKALWPATGFTKGQMIDYYLRVAPALLPHVRGRPLTLGRFPDGVHGPGFAQTECRGRPEWMATMPLRLQTGTVRNFCVVNDLPSLAWVANLASIELHPYLGTGNEARDAVVALFDLDPYPPAGILEAADLALRLCELLEGLGLAAFAKTSGGAGIHVYVPLNVPHAYEVVRDFARELAAQLARERPSEVTGDSRGPDRRGKVRIDWLQNHPRRSTVAPYSLRAGDRPTVSTPLTWSEVEDALVAREAPQLTFTADEVPPRLDELGDPFRGVLESVQRIPAT